MPFSKGGPAGELTADSGATPQAPSESAKASFDGRRLSKVLLRYFHESNKGRCWRSERRFVIEKNDQRNGGKRLGEPQQPEVPG